MPASGRLQPADVTARVGAASYHRSPLIAHPPRGAEARGQGHAHPLSASPPTAQPSRLAALGVRVPRRHNDLGSPFPNGLLGTERPEWLASVMSLDWLEARAPGPSRRKLPASGGLFATGSEGSKVLWACVRACSVPIIPAFIMIRPAAMATGTSTAAERPRRQASTVLFPTHLTRAATCADGV